MSDDKYIPVENSNDLARDVKTNAVINTNRTTFENARKRARDAQRQRDEIRNATREINNLKCEIHEIKDMLKQLIDR